MTKTSALGLLQDRLTDQESRLEDRLRARAWRLTREYGVDVVADVCQETLLQAIMRMHQLRDAKRLDAWLFAILRNVVRKHAREGFRSLQAPPADAGWLDRSLPEGYEEDPIAYLVREEERELLWEVSSKMPAALQKFMRAYAEHGDDAEALMEVMGWTKDLKHRYFQRLREYRRQFAEVPATMPYCHVIRDLMVFAAYCKLVRKADCPSAVWMDDPELEAGVAEDDADIKRRRRPPYLHTAIAIVTLAAITAVVLSKW